MTFTQKKYKSGDVVFIKASATTIWKAKIVRRNKDKRLPGDYIIKDKLGFMHSVGSDMVYSRLSSAHRAVLKGILLIDMTKKDVSK